MQDPLLGTVLAAPRRRPRASVLGWASAGRPAMKTRRERRAPHGVDSVSVSCGGNRFNRPRVACGRRRPASRPVERIVITPSATLPLHRPRRRNPTPPPKISSHGAPRVGLRHVPSRTAGRSFQSSRARSNRPPRATVRPIGSGQVVNDPQAPRRPITRVDVPITKPCAVAGSTSCVPTARVACRTATETDVCANAGAPPRVMSTIPAASRRVIPGLPEMPPNGRHAAPRRGRDVANGRSLGQRHRHCALRRRKAQDGRHPTDVDGSAVERCRAVSERHRKPRSFNGLTSPGGHPDQGPSALATRNPTLLSRSPGGCVLRASGRRSFAPVPQDPPRNAPRTSVHSHTLPTMSARPSGLEP